jgi:hypothetical protein
MVHPQVADEGDRLQLWRTAANILNKYSWTDKKRDGPPAWGLGVELTTLHHKKLTCYEMLHVKVSDH